MRPMTFELKKMFHRYDYQRKTPEEILQSTSDTWYSIVICQLPEEVTPDSIQSKVYHKDGEQFEQTEDGHYLSSYATDTQYEEGITLFPTHVFSTPVEEYDQMTQDQKDMVDAIKKICNNFPCAFFWHDGEKDPGCQFHRLHIHLILGSEKRPGSITLFNTRVQMLKRFGIQVKCQKVKYIDRLIRHLQKPPRRLLGCNNPQLCQMLLDYPYVDEDLITENLEEQDLPTQEIGCSWIRQQIDLDAVRLKTKTAGDSFKLERSEGFQMPSSKNPPKIDVIKSLIEKYHVESKEGLYDRIIECENQNDVDTIRQLRLQNFGGQMFQDAIREIKIHRRKQHYNFVDTLMDINPSPKETLTVLETANVYLRWCKDQEISPGDFLMKLYYICDKTLIKRNAFMLHGHTNAGDIEL